MLYRDYCIHRGVRDHDATWVAPFGNLGIIARWQLPQAYRSLLRPSSPVVPRYPPVCSYVLTKTLCFRNTILKLQPIGSSPMDPLSCLAHESSSLCSFQGTGSNSVAAGDRITKDERIARSLGAVPSKLNSAAQILHAPLPRSASSFSRSRSVDRFAPSLLALGKNSRAISY